MGKLDDLIARLGGGGSSGKFSAMRRARENMVDSAVDMGTGDSTLTARGDQLHFAESADFLYDVGRGDLEEDVRLVEGLVANASDSIYRREVGGQFSPTRELNLTGVVSYPHGSRRVRRHEIMHGYNEHAMKFGPHWTEGGAGLPFASRLVAALPAGSGLERVADEMVATRAGGDRIRDVDWDYYRNLYASQGDVDAAKVAGHVANAQEAARRVLSRMPNNPAESAALYGGAAAASYGALNALLNGQEPQVQAAPR